MGLYWGIMEKKMETTIMGYIEIIGYLGGCQKYGPFLGSYYNTAPNIQGTQQGIIILTTTHLQRLPPKGSMYPIIRYLGFG